MRSSQTMVEPLFLIFDNEYVLVGGFHAHLLSGKMLDIVRIARASLNILLVFVGRFTEVAYLFSHLILFVLHLEEFPVAIVAEEGKEQDGYDYYRAKKMTP